MHSNDRLQLVEGDQIHANLRSDPEPTSYDTALISPDFLYNTYSTAVESYNIKLFSRWGLFSNKSFLINFKYPQKFFSYLVYEILTYLEQDDFDPSMHFEEMI